MTAPEAILLVLSVLVFLYLGVALFQPDRF